MLKIIIKINNKKKIDIKQKFNKINSCENKWTTSKSMEQIYGSIDEEKLLSKHEKNARKK